MAESITIFERFVPPTTTHHAKKIARVGGFARLVDSKALKEAKATWDAVIAPYKPDKPIPGPVAVCITLMWPYRKGEPKKNRGSLLRHDTKPDLDNMAKAIIDSLAKWQFIENDARVCSLTVDKFYAEAGGVRIVIAPVERVA